MLLSGLFGFLLGEWLFDFGPVSPLYFPILGQAANLTEGAIGAALAGGGSLTINAAIVFWFVKYIREVHEANEKRIAELLIAKATEVSNMALANKQETTMLRDMHKEELARRDALHAAELKDVIESQRELSQQTQQTMREVVITLAKLQVNAAFEVKNAGERALKEAAASQSGIHKHGG